MERRRKTQISSGRILLVVVVVLAVTFSAFIILSDVFSILSVTAADTAYVNVTINETVGITLVTNGINFTSSGPGDYRESNNTPDMLPELGGANSGINITNVGNAPINVTVETTTDLFTSVNPASDNSFKCMIHICNGILGGADGGPGECLKSPWNSNYTDCDSDATSTPVHAIANLTFLDGSDSAILDISITVPQKESPGLKQATISLVALFSGV